MSPALNKLFFEASSKSFRKTTMDRFTLFTKPLIFKKFPLSNIETVNWSSSLFMYSSFLPKIRGKIKLSSKEIVFEKFSVFFWGFFVKF